MSHARVVELADSLDSGSSVQYARAGSSPASRTKVKPPGTTVVPGGLIFAMVSADSHIFSYATNSTVLVSVFHIWYRQMLTGLLMLWCGFSARVEIRHGRLVPLDIRSGYVGVYLVHSGGIGPAAAG